MDEGETAEESAVRELREETGYVGTTEEISPVMFNGQSVFGGGEQGLSSLRPLRCGWMKC